VWEEGEKEEGRKRGREEGRKGGREEGRKGGREKGRGEGKGGRERCKKFCI
jgi:hypothetical protein